MLLCDWILEHFSLLMTIERQSVTPAKIWYNYVECGSLKDCIPLVLDVFVWLGRSLSYLWHRTLISCTARMFLLVFNDVFQSISLS